MPQNKRTLKGVLGGLVGLVGLSAVAGVLVTATVTPAIAMTGLAGSQALSLFDELPSYLEVGTPMEPTTIWATDSDGNDVKLASFYDQNRIPVEYDDVAPVLYDAVLSSEDKTFYEHGGVNLGATVKALADYIQGTSSRGASTISQQYVKNVLVQRCEQEVSTSDENYSEKLNACWTDATNASGVEGMERKLQEMRYAIQIEKDYSKNDILLGYLNLANFGGTTYGIEAAAQYYYGVSSSDLNLNQAATLAGMVQNPNTLRFDKPNGSTTNSEGEAINSEADGYSLTLERRDYVLARMLADGKITQEQYDTTKAEPIDASNITPAKQGCATAGESAYFCQYVKSIVETDEAFGDTAEERRETLRRGGLDIYTTLDLDVQNAASDSMTEYVVSERDGIELGAAGVSIEASTGRILAMVQNTDFDESSDPPRGSSSLVFASDQQHGGSRGFPVGSTYKLFTLLEWLEEGNSVNAVLNGTARTFSPFTICGDTVENTTRIGNSGGGGGYTGSVMRFTSASLNTGYLAMAQQLDLCDINAMADRLGVSLATGGSTTDQNVPYDVLGSKNIAPLDMAAAYATVANEGVYCTPRAIDKVITQDGSEMELPESSCDQVISPEVAATAAYALRGVMTSGTGTAANPNDGTPVIGKTGTHQQSQTMMIESSTEVTTAVWVGNITGESRLSNKTSNGISLNRLRFYVARDMQRAANEIYGGDSFPDPDENLTRQVYTDLPNVVGMTVDEASETLREEGFTVTVGSPVDSDLGTDVVAAQSPGAGRVAGGTTVTISPSNGQGTTVPDVTGRDRNSAQAALASAGLSNINWDNACGEPGATVTSTNPAAGSSANRNATISVICSGDGGGGRGDGGRDDDDDR